MPIKTVDDLKRKLEQDGRPLSEVLLPEDFAEEGDVADKIALQFKKDSNPTQMRKVFNTFKHIEQKLKAKNDKDGLDADEWAEISLLKPNLAYAVGRGLLPEDFYTILKLCLTKEKLQKTIDFRRLVQFLTAILAYQKYHSDKKGK